MPTADTGPAAVGTVPAAAPSWQVIVLPGEIDATNDQHVQDTLTRALDDGTAVLVADASGTTFCAASGVRALLLAHHQAAAAAAQLRVVASPAVQRILTLTGVGHVLDTYPDVAAALAVVIQATVLVTARAGGRRVNRSATLSFHRARADITDAWPAQADAPA